MTTEQEIRQRIGQMAEAQKNIVVPKEPSKILTVTLGCCILFLSLLLVVALAFKEPAVPPLPPAPVVVQHDNPKYATRAEVEAEIAKLNQRVDTWSHRLWMLAVASNENANIRQRLDGSQDSGYIVFDEKWRVNRVPNTMILSPEQQKSFEQDKIK